MNQKGAHSPSLFTVNKRQWPEESDAFPCSECQWFGDSFNANKWYMTSIITV